MSLKKQTNSEELLNFGSYRNQDAQQFKVLNEQIKSRQSHSNRSESRQVKPVHQRSFYSESDVALFERILPGVITADKQQTPISNKKINRSFGSVYKQSDDAQFKALMNFNDTQSTDLNVEPAHTHNDDRSFSYSELDLQTFNQLTLGAHDNKANTSDTYSQAPARSERDLGPIKIMEFDGKTTKARKRTRQGNVNIKVRYFD